MPSLRITLSIDGRIRNICRTSPWSSKAGNFCISNRHPMPINSFSEALVHTENPTIDQKRNAMHCYLHFLQCLVRVLNLTFIWFLSVTQVTECEIGRSMGALKQQVLWWLWPGLVDSLWIVCLPQWASVCVKKDAQGEWGRTSNQKLLFFMQQCRIVTAVKFLYTYIYNICIYNICIYDI